jgi:hypothetical protein
VSFPLIYSNLLKAVDYREGMQVDKEKFGINSPADAIRAVVANSGIELFNITQESVESIERQSQDLISKG